LILFQNTAYLLARLVGTNKVQSFFDDARKLVTNLHAEIG